MVGPIKNSSLWRPELGVERVVVPSHQLINILLFSSVISLMFMPVFASMQSLCGATCAPVRLALNASKGHWGLRQKSEACLPGLLNELISWCENESTGALNMKTSDFVSLQPAVTIK